MINPVSPISFQAKAQYEAATKFIDYSGKELGLKIKAISEAPKSYDFDVVVHDSDDFVLSAYKSRIGEGVLKNLAEFTTEAHNELRKIDKMFRRYKVDDAKNIQQGLIDFFVKSAE